MAKLVWDQEKIETLRRLFAEGKSLTEVVTITGWPHASIHSRALANDIAMPTKTEVWAKKRAVGCQSPFHSNSWTDKIPGRCVGLVTINAAYAGRRYEDDPRAVKREPWGRSIAHYAQVQTYTSSSGWIV